MTRRGFTFRAQTPINQASTHNLFGFHQSGVNTAFCDGSVRYWPDDTEAAVIFAAMTRAAGEMGAR